MFSDLDLVEQDVPLVQEYDYLMRIELSDSKYCRGYILDGPLKDDWIDFLPNSQSIDFLKKNYKKDKELKAFCRIRNFENNGFNDVCCISMRKYDDTKGIPKRVHTEYIKRFRK